VINVHKEEEEEEEDEEEKTIGRKTCLKLDGEFSVIIVFVAVHPAVSPSSTQFSDR
jgi:hypothetical protein